MNTISNDFLLLNISLKLAHHHYQKVHALILYIYFFIFADVVDPNRDGYVSLQEYMAFMISKETENVQSSEEIENAFRAITASDRPYVTKEELYAVSFIYVFFEFF